MSVPAAHRTVFLLGPERVEVRELPVPEPGPGDLLLRIEAATTCGTDVKVFRRGGHPRMLVVPGPFGHEMAGVVAASGPVPAGGAQRWRAGDRVVVANSAPCGACGPCERDRENLCADLEYLNGAFGQYLLVPRRFAERSTHRIPDGVPFEVASLSEPLACVLHGVDACGLREPSDVAVYGAGPIGLLFAAALRAEGHRVVIADPNPARLEAGRALGAAEGVRIERGGRQADLVRPLARQGGGFDAAVDATGVPEVWSDAIASVRPGGIVNLFGGCAPGTTVPLDTHRVHYSEITLKGVYHHRPATFARALELLARRAFDARVLLSAERPLEETEEALRSMMRKEALKVVIRPR
ncbi:MAG: alcohol dehydrogenase catalytic domain-containing protein [Planctomycetes bacterium]|nr:alcohol dehydrogenase catalytic domain-containing protein [Planctomycetota bacterium]